MDHVMPKKLQKPGEKPKKSGEYIERGPHGGKIINLRQVTIEPKDTPLPPTKEKGYRWERIGPIKIFQKRKNSLFVSH